MQDILSCFTCYIPYSVAQFFFLKKNLLLNKIHYSLLVHRFRDSRCKHGGGRNSHHRYVLTGRKHFISSYSCKLLIISNTWWIEQKQSIRSAHIIFLLHASPPKLLDARPVTLAWPQTSVSTRIRAIHHHKNPQTPCDVLVICPRAYHHNTI